MPTYTYWCKKCLQHFTVSCSIPDYNPNAVCAYCHSNEMVLRDFAKDDVHTNSRLSLSDIKTLGHYAERQTLEFGKYKVEDMRQKFKTKKDDKPLPEGFKRLTKEDYVKMQPNKTFKGKKRGDR